MHPISWPETKYTNSNCIYALTTCICFYVRIFQTNDNFYLVFCFFHFVVFRSFFTEVLSRDSARKLQQTTHHQIWIPQVRNLFSHSPLKKIMKNQKSVWRYSHKLVSTRNFNISCGDLFSWTQKKCFETASFLRRSWRGGRFRATFIWSE